MAQIVQILNAHLNSLQWIEQNAANVQQRIQDVQRQFGAAQADHDRVFRMRKADYEWKHYPSSIGAVCKKKKTQKNQQKIKTKCAASEVFWNPYLRW